MNLQAKLTLEPVPTPTPRISRPRRIYKYELMSQDNPEDIRRRILRKIFRQLSPTAERF